MEVKGSSILRVELNGLSILRVELCKLDSYLFDMWAELYCEIWKEPPWNENFWKPKAVKKDFCRELGLPHAEAFLALGPTPCSHMDELGEMVHGICECGVVGFTHGYSVSSWEMRMIAGSGLLNSFFKKRERVYYVDELGVAQEYRGRGISRWLTSFLIDAARSHGLSCVLLRTDKQATSARSLYQKLGFVELKVQDARYPERTYWSLEL